MLVVKVEGLAELEKRMRELEPKLAKAALRSAVNAGSQVIKKEAKALAPVNTGRLARKAIYVARSRGESHSHRETYKVGVRLGRKEAQKGMDAFYWWYLEYGTKFISARPFMRPAFEKKKNEAFEAIKKKLKEKLDQITSRLT